MDLLPIIPVIDTSLNGLALALTLSGWLAIKRGHVTTHKILMLSAVGASTLFLGFYSYYHFNAEPVKYPGDGIGKTIYLAILITHVIAAATVPYLVGRTLYHAFRGETLKHRRIARITFPIWVYTSATGILVYLLLYQTI